MTQNEVHEGSVVDLLARIARERSQRKLADTREPDVVDAARQSGKAARPLRRLFPGAPRRRT
jgi:hypothetical protein